MKRTLAVILAGASLVVSACGTGAASPSASTAAPSTGPSASEPAPSASQNPAADECAGGKVAKITFWHTYNTDGPETSRFDAVVIPAFQRKCPNITVEAIVQPYDRLHDQLVTAVAGGGLPDVMRMDIIWTPEFAAARRAGRSRRDARFRRDQGVGLPGSPGDQRLQGQVLRRAARHQHPGPDLQHQRSFRRRPRRSMRSRLPRQR